MVTDEQLAAMTAEQRADLARRLAGLTGGAPAASGTAVVGTVAGGTVGGAAVGGGAGRGTTPGGVAAGRRRWLPVAAVASAVVLTGWIYALANTLPDRYLTDHWNAAWVGYDSALLVGLALTAWAAWRGSPLLVPAAFTTAILLVCDAWFDVMTAATEDLAGGTIAALVAELPLAVVLLRVARPLLAPRREQPTSAPRG